MPLRLVVQALFVQQLNTQHAFKECSESFRFAYSREFSGSLSSSRYQNSKSQNLGDSDEGEIMMMKNPLSCLLENDVMLQRNTEIVTARKEYESTSFRIQNLEQELVTLKKSLCMKNMAKETEEVNPSKLTSYG